MGDERRAEMLGEPAGEGLDDDALEAPPDGENARALLEAGRGHGGARFGCRSIRPSAASSGVNAARATVRLTPKLAPTASSGSLVPGTRAWLMIARRSPAR